MKVRFSGAQLSKHRTRVREDARGGSVISRPGGTCGPVKVILSVVTGGIKKCETGLASSFSGSALCGAVLNIVEVWGPSTINSFCLWCTGFPKKSDVTACFALWTQDNGGMLITSSREWYYEGFCRWRCCCFYSLTTDHNQNTKPLPWRSFSIKR